MAKSLETLEPGQNPRKRFGRKHKERGPKRHFYTSTDVGRVFGVSDMQARRIMQGKPGTLVEIVRLAFQRNGPSFTWKQFAAHLGISLRDAKSLQKKFDLSDIGSFLKCCLPEHGEDVGPSTATSAASQLRCSGAEAAGPGSNPSEEAFQRFAAGVKDPGTSLLASSDPNPGRDLLQETIGKLEASSPPEVALSKEEIAKLGEILSEKESYGIDSDGEY
jgi:hypothetical protein